MSFSHLDGRILLNLLQTDRQGKRSVELKERREGIEPGVFFWIDFVKYRFFSWYVLNILGTWRE